MFGKTKADSIAENEAKILKLKKEIYDLEMENDYSHFSLVERRPSFKEWLENNKIGGN